MLDRQYTVCLSVRPNKQHRGAEWCGQLPQLGQQLAVSASLPPISPPQQKTTSACSPSPVFGLMSAVWLCCSSVFITISIQFIRDLNPGN